jgi:hypothetical protein
LPDVYNNELSDWINGTPKFRLAQAGITTAHYIMRKTRMTLATPCDLEIFFSPTQPKRGDGVSTAHAPPVRKSSNDTNRR